MITLNDGRKYIESNNIRVFPCAYRGYYNSSTTPVTTLVFDPEARATTEANFTSTFHKLSDNKDSYVVAWVSDSATSTGGTGTLKCVIGGYYFEIYNHKMSEFFYDSNSSKKPYYLCIQTTSIKLGTAEPDESEARTTEVLSSFAESTNYLDIKQGNDYAFTGLLISTTAIGDASLTPFIASNYIEAGKAGMVSQTGLYYLNAENEFVSATGVQLDPGTQLYQHDLTKYTYKVDPAKFPVTNLLDVGSGNYSLRMIEDVTEQGVNTTTASGDYSVSLGLGTAATGKASTALGNNTEASAKGAFAVGNNTKASGKGAVALGNNTQAVSDGAVALGTAITAGKVVITEKEGEDPVTEILAKNQVVIGQYNAEDTNQAFIIANGSSTAGSNKFTVSYNGDVKALGTLETKGSIKATGNSNNDLELGANNVENSYGSIKIFGKALPDKTTDESGNEIQPDKIPVFQVTNTGKTTIEGAIDVTGASTLKNTLSVVGETTLQNGLSVTNGNTTLGGSLSIKGNVTLAADSGDTPNTLTLGSDASNISGELNIYGEGTTKVFTVDSTGKTTIEGTTTINGATTITGVTTINNATTITGKTELQNELEVIEKITGKGGLAITSGNTSLGSTTISSLEITQTADVDGNSAALIIHGGTKVNKQLKVVGATTLESTLSVKEPTTLSGDVLIESATDYTSADSAALKVTGGVYVGKKLHVAEQMSLADNLEVTATKVAIKTTTASSTANNGALVVAGGVGIGNNLNVTGNTNISGNVTIASTSSSQPNSLTIGNESTSNKGGQLLIYGPGTTTVFEVDKNGNVTATGNLSLGGDLSIGNKLSIGNDLEISTAGIAGLKSLDVAGQINATVFNALSDARLKTNIEDYTFNKSILDLPIKQFEYINDKTHTKYVGCIAQDLQHICPDLVNENMEGMLSIQESKLIYALLQEVKELRDRVELLERR